MAVAIVVCTKEQAAELNKVWQTLRRIVEFKTLEGMSQAQADQACIDELKKLVSNLATVVAHETELERLYNFTTNAIRRRRGNSEQADIQGQD